MVTQLLFDLLPHQVSKSWFVRPVRFVEEKPDFVHSFLSALHKVRPI